MTRLAIRVGERTFSAEIGDCVDSGSLYLWLDDRAVQVRLPQHGAPPELLNWLVIDDRPCEIQIDPELRWIASEAGRHALEIRDLEDMPVRRVNGGGRVKASIPGQITRVFVAPGQAVVPNQPLCVLEAMKMENEIRSPQAGVVSALPIAVGHVVSRGQLLAEISSG